MSKYADVIKSAKDLLNKNYNFTNKVELKTSTSNGVNYTAEAVVTKPVSMTLKADWASGAFKVDKLQVGSDKKVVAEVSYADVVPNTKVTFKASDGTRASGPEAVSAVVGAEYVTKKSTFTADFDALNRSLDTTSLVKFDSFLFGATAKVDLNGKFDIKDKNVLLGYKNADSTVAFQTEKNFQNGTLSYYQSVAPSLATSAMVKFPLAFKETASFNMDAGLSYKLNADTTVFARANNSGKVGFSYQQQINSMAKLTFSAEVDAANIGSDDHKYGINLALSG